VRAALFSERRLSHEEDPPAGACLPATAKSSGGEGVCGPEGHDAADAVGADAAPAAGDDHDHDHDHDDDHDVMVMMCRAPSAMPHSTWLTRMQAHDVTMTMMMMTTMTMTMIAVCPSIKPESLGQPIKQTPAVLLGRLMKSSTEAA